MIIQIAPIIAKSHKEDVNTSATPAVKASFRGFGGMYAAFRDFF